MPKTKKVVDCTSAAEPISSEKITFFGKVDRNNRGNISSEYPAWALKAQFDDLKESVSRNERLLESGNVVPSERPYLVETLEKEKRRLNEIEESMPKLTTKQKDDAYAAYKELSNKIAESLFSRDEMRLGLADAHEEARRMVNPVIDVDPKFAAACGVTPKNGKVSRNEASRMFKIMGAYLGEKTNVEYLRKDRRR